MEWWGPSTRLEYVDSPDALIIRAHSVRRRGDLIWPCAAALFCFGALCLDGNWIAILVSALFSGLLFWGWFGDSSTELRVTDRELRSSSSGRAFDNAASIHWSEVKRLEYQGGGEYDSKGLYAKKSFWSSTCLVPNIDDGTTLQIINAIYRRFPLPDMPGEGDGRPAFLKDTLIKLGLSGKDS